MNTVDLQRLQFAQYGLAPLYVHTFSHLGHFSVIKYLHTSIFEFVYKALIDDRGIYLSYTNALS